MADYQTDNQTGSPANPQARRTFPSQGAASGQLQDQLSEEYTIDTPENVSFGYEVAGIGSRFIAALIDNIILLILLIALNVAVIVAIAALNGDSSSIDQGLESADENWIAGLVIALYALLNFLIWWGYYMIFEWVWHGQTIGKRAVRIRIVRLDGAPVTFVPVAVRNLVRIVDFLPAFYAVGVVTMFCNRQSRRLGDFAAGTLAIKDQGALTLESLMSSVPKAPASTLRTDLPLDHVNTAVVDSGTDSSAELTPDQDWSGIRRLTPSDYELVQETLARYRKGSLDKALLRRVAAAIATKLERPPSSQLEGVDEAVAFLDAVAVAYGRWVK
jgi:uncharacterized RDD family membrane protein YckC